MELQGKYGNAIVYTDDVEQEAISQIISLLNEEMANGAHVRIMPDVHAGSGCVIGYTARLTDKVVPNLIGVDIGCGMTSWPLGSRSKVGEGFDKLDKIIRKEIPSGKNVLEAVDFKLLERLYNTLNVKGLTFADFKEKVDTLSSKVGNDRLRSWCSIGSLGGGNHFIEIDKDDNDDLWLTIHSGSRGFGLKVALYHQSIAETQSLTMPKAEFDAKVKEIRETKKGKGIQVAIEKLKKTASVKKHKRTGLEFLEGVEKEAYFHDMHIAQIYAQLSRRVMGYKILKKRYKIDYFTPVESVHNYINFDDGIMRKGSISAHKGEEVIIPLNMADGIIFGVGKGNEDWNFSAPHGAGRKMSRSKAKATITLEDFQRKMKKSGVWSSCIGKDTLDEAPQAYKNADHIIDLLKDTVDIRVRMYPVYNYKATE